MKLYVLIAGCKYEGSTPYGAYTDLAIAEKDAAKLAKRYRCHNKITSTYWRNGDSLFVSVEGFKANKMDDE